MKNLIAKGPIGFHESDNISVSKSSSFISNTEVEQLYISNTFRFAVYGEWCEMENGTYELIFFVPKSSRVHDYSYGEILKSLNFRTPELNVELTEYVEVLCSNGAWITEDTPEDTTDENDNQTSFTTGDPHALIMMLLGIILEKQNKGCQGIEQGIVPNHIAIERYIHENGMTKDEIDQIIESYRENTHGGNEFTIGEEKSLKYILSKIPELPSFTTYRDKLKAKEKFKYEERVIKAIDEYCVIDKQTRRVYPSSFGEHYSTVVYIVSRNYKDEFEAMTQEEKDAFILRNFELKGAYYPPETNRYVPEKMALEHMKYADEKEYTQLSDYKIIETEDGVVAIPIKH